MYNRMARDLRLLAELYVTSAELAERFECCQRTAQRLIAELEPIHKRRTPSGQILGFLPAIRRPNPHRGNPQFRQGKYQREYRKHRKFY